MNRGEGRECSEKKMGQMPEKGAGLPEGNPAEDEFSGPGPGGGSRPGR